MKARPLPPIALLDKLFSYEPELGVLTRRIKASQNTRAGSVAGFMRADGRWLVSVNNTQYHSHRICWALHNRQDPAEMQIDHIDGDPSNNRIANLRLATSSQNAQNSGSRGGNLTGFKGVSLSRKQECYYAEISLGGESFYGPRRGTAEEAHEDYKALSAKHHGEFGRTTMTFPRESSNSMDTKFQPEGDQHNPLNLS